jgi:hypothetical protein
MTPEINPTLNDAQRRLERQRQADLDAQERMYQRALAEQQARSAATPGDSAEDLADAAVSRRGRQMFGAGDVRVSGNVVSHRTYGNPATTVNLWVVENGSLQLEALTQPAPDQ